MALVAHRMMLPARHRRTHQQVARNKVGVLLVPSLADYYNRETDQPQLQQLSTSMPQLELQVGDGTNAKVSSTSCSHNCNHVDVTKGNIRNLCQQLLHLKKFSSGYTTYILTPPKEIPIPTHAPVYLVFFFIIRISFTFSFFFFFGWRQLYAAHCTQT